MSDHIVTDTKTGHFKCEFCGAQEAPPFMPAPIDTIIDAMDTFTAAHEGCKRPPSEAVMSEYIKGFDAGYGYVLSEIERYIDVYPTDVFAVKELLAHLKMEDKPNGKPNQS